MTETYHVWCPDYGHKGPEDGAPIHGAYDAREAAETWAARALGRYYSDPADAIEDAENEGVGEPMLLICEPEYVRPIENDYFQDQLPEDEDDLPCEIAEAMDAFNAAVSGVILSWVPGEFALDLECEE